MTDDIIFNVIKVFALAVLGVPLVVSGFLMYRMSQQDKQSRESSSGSQGADGLSRM